jgi:hypothetical protein
VKRKALLLTTNFRTKISICIDEKNANEIIEYINQDKRHKKKWDFISNIILENLKNSDVFDKENINSKCEDVYAMKFFKGQENDRIYCKKVKQEDGSSIIIVASELHLKKKVQKNSAKEIGIIEKVASYEYEIEK